MSAASLSCRNPVSLKRQLFVSSVNQPYFHLRDDMFSSSPMSLLQAFRLTTFGDTQFSLDRKSMKKKTESEK